MKTKILVTGSEGSLMQQVIPRLIMDGYEVIGVDNLYRHGTRERNDSYTFIQGDLTNEEFVHEVVRQNSPRFIIQAAAKIFGIGGFNAHRAEILSDDVKLHINVLNAAKKYFVSRVVYISSSMVYENCIQDELVPVSEDMPDKYPPPATDYGLSKYMGERLCRAYKEQYGLPYTIWRPFNIITPFEKSEGEVGTSHVFADYIKTLVIDEKRVLPIIGDGNQIRCFTWIGDVAEVIATLSFDDRAMNQTFNIGREEPVSMKDLAILILDKHFEFNPSAKYNYYEDLTFQTVANYDHDVRVRIPDGSKFREVFGPHHIEQTLDQSIHRCLEEAYRAHGKKTEVSSEAIQAASSS